jgi:Putative Ig domain/PLD-like domain
MSTRRRISVAIATATAVLTAFLVPTAAHAATGTYSLLVLPDQGETQIYNFINSAKSSIDMTMYELRDTTVENDLIAREKAGVTVRVILDGVETSVNSAAYSALQAGGVGVTYSSSAFTYTHQKTITVDNDESYISTGNLDTMYYSTSRDYGVFDTDQNDVSAIVAVFNADYAKTSITPGDGDDLVWSPTDSQSHLLSLINSAQHTLDVQQEEFSDTTLVNAIVADAKRGVTVRGVIENESSDYQTEINEVTAAGGTVTTYTSSTGYYIHAKSIIVDYGTSTAKVFLGSENMTDNSLNDNRELGLITSDPGVITGVESSFTADFDKATSSTVSVTNPGNQTGGTGTAASLQISATDTASGTLTYSAVGLPAGLSISTSGKITGTPTTAGTSTVVVTATDAAGRQGAASFTWTISGSGTGNTVTVTNPGNQTGTSGTAVSLQLSATDSASGQTLTYSATGLPTGLSISTAGKITGTPTAAGTFTVTVTATDTTGAHGSVTFTWTISGSGTGNTVTVTNPGNQTGTTGTAVSLQLSGTDSASGQTLTYTATGLPTGLSISSAGKITGTPTAAGTYTVTVTATDTTGVSGSVTFTWTVTTSGGTCTAAQLLGNPGFETGTASPWTAAASVISDSSTEPPHSGTWDAWLDGYGATHTDTLSQTVTLPAGCTTYQLGFWLHIDTAETSTSTAYDTMTVQLLNSSGTVLTTLATYSNLNHNTGYAQHTFSVASYAGQSVTLKFTGTEDYTKQTSFVVDDTALNVS